MPKALPVIVALVALAAIVTVALLLNGGLSSGGAGAGGNSMVGGAAASVPQQQGGEEPAVPAPAGEYPKLVNISITGLSAGTGENYKLTYFYLNFEGDAEDLRLDEAPFSDVVLLRDGEPVAFSWQDGSEPFTASYQSIQDTTKMSYRFDGDVEQPGSYQLTLRYAGGEYATEAVQVGGGQSGTPASSSGYAGEVVTVKHIYVDSSPEGGKTQEEARQAIDDIYAQLQTARASGEDVEQAFDQLIEEYGEDPGQPPEGYTIGEGTMVEAFYEVSVALEVGEFSEPVETVHGYHIILRLA